METVLSNFVRDFEARVSAMQGVNALKIANGSLPDYHTYKRACGRNEGLGDAVNLAKAMLQETSADDDDSLPEMQVVT